MNSFQKKIILREDFLSTLNVILLSFYCTYAVLGRSSGFEPVTLQPLSFTIRTVTFWLSTWRLAPRVWGAGPDWRFSRYGCGTRCSHCQMAWNSIGSKISSTTSLFHWQKQDGSKSYRSFYLRQIKTLMARGAVLRIRIRVRSEPNFLVGSGSDQKMSLNKKKI